MRIVSLVPSDTYTLIRLGGGPSLVGRTKYCVEPSDEVDSIEIVGGTKDPNIARIIELAPDLVILNQEENTKSDASKLESAGVRTLVTFPKRVADGVAQVARFARLLGPIGSRKKELVRFAYKTHLEAEALRNGRTPRRVFVPIWIDPLMTIHGDTYLSDQLDLAGGVNVFADRRRRFPLAFDMSGHATHSPHVLARETHGTRALHSTKCVSALPRSFCFPMSLTHSPKRKRLSFVSSIFQPRNEIEFDSAMVGISCGQGCAV